MRPRRTLPRCRTHLWPNRRLGILLLLILGIAAGVLGLGFGIGRWRRSARNAAAAGEAPARLEALDEKRLDSDLARYDL